MCLSVKISATAIKLVTTVVWSVYWLILLSSRTCVTVTLTTMVAIMTVVVASLRVRQRNHVFVVAEGKNSVKRLEQTDRHACRQNGPGNVSSVSVCLSVSVFVCVSVREHISGTTRPIFTNFCMLPMAVAWSSYGDVAIPGTLITSGIMDDVIFVHMETCRYCCSVWRHCVVMWWYRLTRVYCLSGGRRSRTCWDRCKRVMCWVSIIIHLVTTPPATRTAQSWSGRWRQLIRWWRSTSNTHCITFNFVHVSTGRAKAVWGGKVN